MQKQSPSELWKKVKMGIAVALYERRGESRGVKAKLESRGVKVKLEDENTEKSCTRLLSVLSRRRVRQQTQHSLCGRRA